MHFVLKSELTLLKLHELHFGLVCLHVSFCAFTINLSKFYILGKSPENRKSRT